MEGLMAQPITDADVRDNLALILRATQFENAASPIAYETTPWHSIPAASTAWTA